jgi:hypothetical protein
VGGGPDWRSQRWSVALYFGGVRGGPDSDLQEALIASGWDQPRPDPITGVPRETPRSARGGVSLMGALRYQLSPLLAAELLVSSAETGKTSGFQSPVDLQLRHSVLSVAPLASARLSILHVGAGPALHFARASYSPTGYEETHLRFGLVGDLGIAFPENYVAFLDVRLQYRLVGNVEVGPVTDVGPDAAGFPAAEVSYNHLYISAGLGFRF